MLNTKNLLPLPLTVRVQDYNIAAQNPEFIGALRLLTLSRFSGMNHELDSFANISLERDVKCKIITAYHTNELVGWALLSEEQSTFDFSRVDCFNPEHGLMFQVYVQPQYRRQGIAAELMKVANTFSNGKKLWACPWDETSFHFYGKMNETYKAYYL